MSPQQSQLRRDTHRFRSHQSYLHQGGWKIHSLGPGQGAASAGERRALLLEDSWPSLPHCSRWLPPTALCARTSRHHTGACAFIGLPSSCLSPWFPYHVTHNGPLLATQPTTSQNTRPASKKRECQSFPSAKTQGRN